MATASSATPWQRLASLVRGWGTVGCVYGLCGWLQGAGVVVPETALDQAIPFDPAGIGWYLSFFALVPCAYGGVHANRLRWLERSTQWCALVSGVVFLNWPTTLRYPTPDTTTWAGAALRAWTGVDTAQNCLPSLHGALTCLAVWALAERRRPWRTALVVAWGLAILYATLQTRRHLGVDLLAGVCLGGAVGLAVRGLTRCQRTACSAVLDPKGST